MAWRVPEAAQVGQGGHGHAQQHHVQDDRPPPDPVRAPAAPLVEDPPPDRAEAGQAGRAEGDDGGGQGDRHRRRGDDHRDARLELAAGEQVGAQPADRDPGREGEGGDGGQLQHGQPERLGGGGPPHLGQGDLAGPGLGGHGGDHHQDEQGQGGELDVGQQHRHGEGLAVGLGLGDQVGQAGEHDRVGVVDAQQLGDLAEGGGDGGGVGQAQPLRLDEVVEAGPDVQAAVVDHREQVGAGQEDGVQRRQLVAGRRGREVGGLGAEPVLVAGRGRVDAGDHQVAAGGAGPEPLGLEAVAEAEAEPVGGAAAQGRLGRQAERPGRRAAAGLQHQPGAEAVAAGQVRAARAPALGQQRDRGAGLQAGDRRGQRRHGRPGRGHRLGEAAQLLAVGHDLADVQAGGVAGGGAQVLGEQRLPGGAQVDGAGRAHPDREGGHGQQRRRQPGPGPQPAQGQPERAHRRSSCPREASYAPAVLMSRPPGPSRPAAPGPGS